MKMPKIKPDPEMDAQKLRAKNDKITAIQEGLSDETLSLFRRFGGLSSLTGTAGTPSLATGLGLK